MRTAGTGATPDLPKFPLLGDILPLLPKGGGLTAKKIAKLLGTTKSEVNGVLYHAPTSLVSKDPATHEWSLCIPPAPPPNAPPVAPTQPGPPKVTPQSSILKLPDGSTTWSYHRLFAEHLLGAHKITIRDPYIRKTYQIRNLLEFLRMVHGLIAEGDEATVLLQTKDDTETHDKQAEGLNRLTDDFSGTRIAFSWHLSAEHNMHARSIETDTGIKILIDRGLDIFQYFETGPLSVAQSIQELRRVKNTEITYLKL